MNKLATRTQLVKRLTKKFENSFAPLARLQFAANLRLAFKLKFLLDVQISCAVVVVLVDMNALSLCSY